MIRYLPETFKIFCNMAVSLSNWLSRKIEQSSISDKAKLVLFGIASPTPIQDFAKKSAPKPEKTLQADYDEIQRRLTLWLESPGSLASDPTAADLADRLGIPQRQLKAFFQFHLGRNFRTWKSEIKMEKAKEMLLDDRYDTVSEVADALGFRDDASLHRLFHRTVGCTPGLWKAAGGQPDRKDL